MTDVIHTHTDINCETGEVTVRPYTAEELVELEERKAAAEAAQQAHDAEVTRVNALKTSARTKLVAGEPLTDEEAAVIVL